MTVCSLIEGVSLSANPNKEGIKGVIIFTSDSLLPYACTGYSVSSYTSLKDGNADTILVHLFMKASLPESKVDVTVQLPAIYHVGDWSLHVVLVKLPDNVPTLNSLAMSGGGTPVVKTGILGAKPITWGKDAGAESVDEGTSPPAEEGAADGSGTPVVKNDEPTGERPFNIKD